MRYLLTIYSDESRWADSTPEDGAALMGAYNEFTREVSEAGVLVASHGLQPTATATTVRLRDGELMLTDGPFAETREQLGGFYLLECSDLDEAIGWAGRIPNAADGCVEVRPVMVFDQPGSEGSANHDAAVRG